MSGVKPYLEVLVWSQGHDSSVPHSSLWTNFSPHFLHIGSISSSPDVQGKLLSRVPIHMVEEPELAGIWAGNECLEVSAYHPGLVAILSRPRSFDVHVIASLCGVIWRWASIPRSCGTCHIKIMWLLVAVEDNDYFVMQSKYCPLY